MASYGRYRAPLADRLQRMLDLASWRRPLDIGEMYQLCLRYMHRFGDGQLQQLPASLLKPGMYRLYSGRYEEVLGSQYWRGGWVDLPHHLGPFCALDASGQMKWEKNCCVCDEARPHITGVDDRYQQSTCTRRLCKVVWAWWIGRRGIPNRFRDLETSDARQCFMLAHYIAINSREFGIKGRRKGDKRMQRRVETPQARQARRYDSSDLRTFLFEEIQALRDGQRTSSEAQAVASLAKQIIASAQLELDAQEQAVKLGSADAGALALRPPVLALTAPEEDDDS